MSPAVDKQPDEDAGTKESEARKKPRKRRSRRRWLLRILTVAALLAVGLTVAAWVWLESNAGRERLRLLLERRGSETIGRPVRIASLDLELFPLQASLAGIEIAGAQGADQALLHADRLQVHIRPWALLSRQVVVRSLEIDAPVLHWDVPDDAPGDVAAPSRREPGFSVEVERLIVSNGSVELNHRRWHLDTVLTEIEVGLQPGGDLVGLATRRSGFVRAGAGNVRIDRTGGDSPGGGRLELEGAELLFTLENDRLEIDRARLAAGESELTADGEITNWREGRVVLGARIAVVDAVELLAPSSADTHQGEARLDGTLIFGDEPLRFAGTLASDSLSSTGIEATDLRAVIDATTSRISVRDAQARLFEGTVRGSLEVDLSTIPTAWRLEYDGSGVDLARLTGSPMVRGLRFAGIAGARGNLGWQTPWRETLSGSGALNLSLPAGTLADLAPLPSDSTTASVEQAPIAGQLDEVAASTGGRQEARPTPSLPLPLEAEAEYDIDRGTLLLHRAVASLPRTEAVLTGSVDFDGALAAQFDFESTDLRMVDRFFTQIRRFRGEQPIPQPLGLTGNGRVAASIGGRFDDPTVDGSIAAGMLSVAGNPIGDLTGDLRLAGSSLEVLDLQVRRENGRAEGEGRFRIGARTDTGTDYSLGLRLTGYPMQVTLPRLGVPLSAAGEASGELALTGTYGGPPSGAVELQGARVRLNDLGELTANVRVRLDASEWVAERFELGGPRGRLRASGTWRRDVDSVQARLDGSGIEASVFGDVTGAEIPLGGSLELQAQLTGPFSAPNAAAVLRWTDAEALGVSIGSVASSAELRSGSLAVSAVGRSDPDAPAVPPPTPTASGGTVPVPLPELPAAGWAATLSTDLSAPFLSTYRAAGEPRWVLAALASQGYVGGEEIDVRGALDVEGSGPLRDWRSWTGSATLADFDLAQRGLSFSIPDPLTLRLESALLRIDLPRLVSDAGTLVADATIDVGAGRWLEANASGSVSLDVIETLTEEWELGGRLDIAMQASGDVLEGDLAGSIDLHDVLLRNPKWPWFAENLQGSVRLSEDRFRLVDVVGTTSGRAFRAEGEMPLAALAGDQSSDPAWLEVGIDELPLQPVWERAGALQELLTGGSTSATISVEGFGTNWRSYGGSVEVRDLEVRFADLRLRMPEPTRLSVGDARVTFTEPILLRGPGTNLEVGGAFLLGPFRLDTTLAGVTTLDPLNAVTGSWGVAGQAEIDVHVAGDPPDLGYDGTVAITSGLINAPIAQPIESISVMMTFENRLLRIDSFTGALGGGRLRGDGNVRADGEIQLRNSIPQRFLLNVAVDDAQLRLQPGVRVTASADLVHEGTFDGSVLSGTVSVSEADYTQRWESEAALLELSDTDVTGVDHALAGTVNLDFEVRAPGDVRILNNMADVELRADLEVRGTLAEPVLLGSATVLDGDVTLRDHRYRFIRGSVEFQNPLRTEPSFDFLAETSIRQYLVTVGVSGSPDRGDLQATFASSPPLSDLQLIQLLTVGDAPDDATRRETDDETLGAVGAQATSFLTRQYMGQVERGAQRVFGVDRFRVEPAVVEGSGDPTARVTLGKQVTPDLWISWTSIVGTTEEQLVKIEYQLTRGIRITATREEDGSLGVDFRFDHRFR